MLIDRLRGRRVVASISGGKDSAAMSLHLRELGIEHDRVFLDTGWEHPATYEYLRGELTRVLGPIAEARAPYTLPEYAVDKGIFPSRLRRWCTEKLKVLPMRDYLERLADTGVEPVNAVGIRHAESESRAKMGEWEWSESFDCETWRPILTWTEQQVIDIHHRHGLRPNPLYLLGARRVGCWPCIHASKAEIRLMSEVDPARVDTIRDLEARVTATAREKIAARGEELQHERTFFRAKDDATQDWPIDKVVEWARTSRGGRQIELFGAPEDAGCMRWGLCDTGEK